MKYTKKQITLAVFGGLAFAALTVLSVHLFANMVQQAADEIRQWDGPKIRIEVVDDKK